MSPKFPKPYIYYLLQGEAVPQREITGIVMPTEIYQCLGCHTILPDKEAWDKHKKECPDFNGWQAPT